MPPATVPDTPQPTTSAAGNVFTRLARFYHDDWFPAPALANSPAPPAPATAAPARRGLPSPLDSPPFPSADWSYGGSPVIGEPDTGTYPLMTAINHARSRTKIYGWLEPTLNFSTSSTSNAPEANDFYSNRFELAQSVLYIERLPDSVQRAHADWGFHLTALYGTDYRYTTGKGYFSHQWLDLHRQYGFDPSLEYLDIYLPKIGQGTNIRIGRFISIPGVEAQLAPNNYIFSHSLLYSIDPFTDTGILATTKINDQWLVQIGLAGGHDVALWTPDAKPSLTACVDYTSPSVNDNFYLCANGVNDAKYAFNNIQQYDATWYHRFTKTFHMASEAWYMYERDVPAIHGPIAAETGSNPAFCLPGESRCTAPEYAEDTSLQKELSLHDYVAVRGDFLDDKKGQRTGYPTRYSEVTFSWSHWIGSTIQLRPELRVDHAWDVRAYDNGRSRNQFTAASDLIYHF
ncbi:MAG TPA: outer membrane beta-barrel protein [Acidobacteriaceae bacterium]|nr:outer membrane beta-barrel protein [Acidobacteriaceae bacterium]